MAVANVDSAIGVRGGDALPADGRESSSQRQNRGRAGAAAIRSIPNVAWRRPGLVLASLAINVLSLALPVVILHAYDRIIPNAAVATFTLMLIGLGVVILLDGLLRSIRSYFTSWSAARFEHAVFCRAVQTMTDAPLRDFERDPAGTQLDRVQAIDQLREFYGGQGLIVLIDLPFVVIFLAVVAAIGGWLVLVPILMLAAAALAALHVGARLRKALEQRNLVDARRYNFIIEVLNGIHTVKALAIEALMSRRHERLQAASSAAGYDAARESSRAHAIGAFFGNATMFTTAAAAALMVLDGIISQGMMAACTLLAGRAVQPFLRGVAFWSQFQTVRLAEDSLTEILSLAPESPRLADSPDSIRGEIRLEEVTFRFEDAETPLFRDLDLEVMPGEIVAIQGDNGVGKSTLLNIINGIDRAVAGSVRIDGIEIGAWEVSALRRQVAYMPQYGTLLRGTLLENLTLFSPEQNIDAAMRYACKLGLDTTIARLPDGLDTFVADDQSDMLPRGVRQQIAIVRTLVREPPVLLFDEANSSLDFEADRRLRALMEELKEDRTIVMVSHRPSMVAVADKIMRIENGRLALKRAWPRGSATRFAFDPETKSVRPVTDGAAGAGT